MGDWRWPGLNGLREANPCDGCHECGLRCTAGIQMTRDEFDRIVKHLRASDTAQVTRVLEQEKTVAWFEDVTFEACPFYDVTQKRCIVYPVRPLVCRLFGRVEWLPCPLGKRLPQIKDGVGLMQAYAGERRRSFAEWCMELGIFDFSQLTDGGR